ncbi:pacearchaeosortase [archaeon]|jgi:exosortase/archaeosortase family protein|nr:pacearchaeosortase [archaeon]MBT3578209.1 pacearchaeosortase [archaeon]MBT6819870.1 pacearchaeosortase [archaeon]MBT6956570.1 pacearchaeosortase [archaeon]MBT7025652.1 pacearchaeosortase [archaeon]
MRKFNIGDFILRYVIILLAGLGNLFIFYWVFTPLTIKAVSFILGIFSNTITIGNQIFSSLGALELIPPCIAGAAFFLLFALILSTARLSIKKRAWIFLSSSAMFFVLNIARIIFLFLISEKPYFETFHWISWNILSTVLVIAVWLFNVWLFKVKSVPVYTDFEELLRVIKPKKSKRRK